MAVIKFVVLAVFFGFCSCIKFDVTPPPNGKEVVEQPIYAVVNETTDTINDAKKHIGYMLTLPSPKHPELIAECVKDTCVNLSIVLERISVELTTKATKDHTTGLVDACHKAAANFSQSAIALRALSGSNFLKYNDEFFKAAELILQEAINMIDEVPCDEIEPIIEEFLKELKEDIDHYQDRVHDAVSPHVPISDLN